MKRAYFILAAAALVGAGACQKGTDDTPPATDKRIEINTSIANHSGASGTTRTPQLNGNGSGNFADGDRITLFVRSESGQTTATDYTVGVSKLYWKNIRLNPEDTKADFSACYPEQKVADGKFTFNIETSPDKDLLLAQSRNITVESEEPVDLLFTHAMHRLVINYSTQSDIKIDEITTVCTAKSTCDVDLNTQTLDSSASGKADFSASGRSAQFMIVPQKVSDIEVLVTVDQMSKKFALSELVTDHEDLENGKQLTVNIKVRDGKIVLEGSSIVQWGDQGTVEGDIIL